MRRHTGHRDAGVSTTGAGSAPRGIRLVAPSGGDTWTALVWALAFALLLAVACDVARAGDVAEPPGLWTGAMYGETPATLSGATVVDLAGVEGLLPEHPLLLDVGPAPHKPEGLPPGRLWLPTHRSIPGAVWMPGAGLAPLEAGREARFIRRIAELSKGDKTHPIVVFCRPACWGSWNAGKRLVLAGYARVYWFPPGIEGWQDLHDTAEARPDAVWSGEPAR